jgi:hypothetical protein
MDPKEIAKDLTELGFNDGVVLEDSGRILTGWGPFKIYFRRGTVMTADYVAPGRSRDLDLYFVGINSMKTSLMGVNSDAIPRAFILATSTTAKELYGMKMPKGQYLTPFGVVLTFNAKNVAKMERIGSST